MIPETKHHTKIKKVSPVKLFILLVVILFIGIQLLIHYITLIPQESTTFPPLLVDQQQQQQQEQHVRRRHDMNNIKHKYHHQYHNMSQFVNSRRSHRQQEGGVSGHNNEKRVIYNNKSISTISHSINHSQEYLPIDLYDNILMTLPSVSLDKSEYIMSSLIERSMKSQELHLTTFFLNSAMISPRENRLNKAERVNEECVNTWKEIINKMKHVPYMENGKRSPRIPYHCRIFNSMKSKDYKVPGEFVPNRQTTDPNTNRRVDVLRCPMKLSEEEMNMFAKTQSSYHLFVEIYRKDVVVGRFFVPWSWRRVGYLMTPPQIDSSSLMSLVSGSPDDINHVNSIVTKSTGLDSWSSVVKTRGNIHICVVGLLQVQNTPGMLKQMLEFIEHHLQVGISHMYFSLQFSDNSEAMNLILDTFQSYIERGYLTITSTAGDHVHMVDSFGGVKWNALSVDTFVISSSLYLAKGAAEYLGVWDINEFFVPRLPHSTVLDVINSVSTPNGEVLSVDSVSGATANSWKGGRGLADGNAHPFCYLNLQVTDAYLSEGNNYDKIFVMDISQLFDFKNAIRRNGNTKSIFPTEIIYQGGIISPGVCKLEPHWANCDMELLDKTTDSDKYLTCITNDPSSNWVERQTMNKEFLSHHEYDDVVTPADSKSIQYDTEGYLVRLNFFKEEGRKRETFPFSDPQISKLLEKSEILTSSVSRKIPKLTLDLEEKTKLIHDWPEWTKVIKSENPPPKDPSDVLPAHTSEADRIYYGSRNGYLNFTEDFARPDVLLSPVVDDLPAFATDYSDIAVGAVIERKHESWDLHMTTFFLNHNFFWQPIEGYGMGRISKENREKWEMVAYNFNKTTYSKENGKRVISDVFSNRTGARTMIEELRYKCRIKNSNRPQDEEYLVRAVFMPNKLTPDQNANNRLDILRCPIKASKDCYLELAGTDHKAEVYIVGPNGNDIFHYFISWKSRRTGYLLSSPAMATSFQPWKAFDRNSTKLPGVVGSDMLYMSVPGVESTVSQFTLPMYLEFLQHHVLIGVEHVFMACSYGWNGAMMSNFLVATKSFIDDGLLSVNSQSGDNFDLLYSFLGGSLDRDTVKIFHVNMYLYLTKGMVDYLGVWDIDEYFIPQLPHHTIQDVIMAAESPEPLKPFPLDADPYTQPHKPGPGWADGDGHPFCYLMLSSECIFSSLGYPEVFDLMKPWYVAVF